MQMTSFNSHAKEVPGCCGQTPAHTVLHKLAVKTNGEKYNAVDLKFDDSC